MNKLTSKLLLAVCCFFSTWVNGQNLISPITINLPNNPPANTANWATALPPVMILAQTKLQNGQVNGNVQETRILVTIKSNGNKVCGIYTPTTAPLSNFNSVTKSWSGANALSLLGQDCILKAGSYEFCVQFYAPYYNGSTSALVGESCKPFTIKDDKQENYAPPQNISPTDGKSLKQNEAKTPLTFRWTPIVPKPQQPVTYRLKVWQLMQGQTASAAIKSNNPVVDKEIKDQTQFVKTNLLGDIERLNNADVQLVWNVAATQMNAQGNVTNLGTSEPTAFRIIVDDPSSGACFSIDTSQYKVVCNGVDANGKPIYTVKDLILKNIGANPGRTGNNGSPATNYIVPNTSGITISNISPASATNILPGTSVNNISFNINGATGTTASVIINANIPSPTNPNIACNKNIELTFDLPSCACTACDSIKIDVTSNATPSQNGNNVKFAQPISTLALPANTPLKIKSITAEILYVDIKKDDEQCYRCDKNNDHYGKFVSASLSATGFSQTSILPSGEAIFTKTNASALTTANLGFEISAPDLNRCCKDKVNVCIKYTIVTEDCKSCSVIKCYTLPRSN
ncbi:MAG: hypothetical protein KA319_02855 [Ferruginibacter sp.]|nr:hypothetical protein [Ferruginibacter sp.]